MKKNKISEEMIKEAVEKAIKDFLDDIIALGK